MMATGSLSSECLNTGNSTSLVNGAGAFKKYSGLSVFAYN